MWKSAFIGAIGIHVALAVFSIVVPNLWEKSRPMPPVYTVKLFETVDLPSPKVAKPKKQAPIVKPKPKTQKIKKKVVPPPTKSKQKKAVSLRPKKPKTIKKSKPKPVATKDTERLNKALKNLKERVKEKESEAVIKNRLSAIESSVEDRIKKSAIATAGTAGSGQLHEVLRLYCIEIWAKVRNQWVLPEQLLDKTNLTSIVVVRIAQDGRVLNAEHEHKSGHALFDQSAIRAVQKASPFPPLPSALRPGPLEIGIRFRPGEVGL
ncbi:MAG: TonB family protein [Deltaproteobacteria bacterium]|nr:TonB family protein [Deltaproteobacteria bacterium]MBW1964147.1 TonB family protein [Deltaproteobacteria bacterium]